MGQPEVRHIVCGLEAADAVSSKRYCIHTTQLAVVLTQGASSIPECWGRIRVPMEATFRSKIQVATTSAHSEIEPSTTAEDYLPWAVRNWDMQM